MKMKNCGLRLAVTVQLCGLVNSVTDYTKIKTTPSFIRSFCHIHVDSTNDVRKKSKYDKVPVPILYNIMYSF